MRTSMFVDKVRTVVDTDGDDTERPITLVFTDDQGSEIHHYLTADVARRIQVEIQRALAAI